jgi:hypothetical protein
MSIERELLKQAIPYIIRIYGTKEESDKANDLISMIQKELAKPDPEPVAWISNGQLKDLKNKNYSTSVYCHSQKSEKSNIPLYTSPPKREPLSEEAIITIINDNFDTDDIVFLDHLNEFTRAIEKSHGIGN